MCSSLFLVFLPALGIVTFADQDIILSFNGSIYTNNSILALTEIGNNKQNGLKCHSINIKSCCSGESRGRWRYPSGIGVKMNVSSMEPLKRERGVNITYLYFRNNMDNTSAGIYTCEIGVRNTSRILQVIFIGLYPINEGGIPSILSLIFNTSSGMVVCISKGGPVSQVTWNKNGTVYQQHQQITDTSLAIYNNILSINSADLSDYSGLFTCSVSNTRGTDTKSMLITAIKVSYQEEYSEGSIADSSCYSNLSVESITWYAEQNKQLNSTSSQQALTLHIPAVTAGHNNTEYTCVINILLLPQEIIISVNRSFILKVTVDSTQDVPPLLIIAISIIVGLLCVIVVVIIIVFLLIFINKNRSRKLTHDKTAVNGNEISSFIEYSDDEEPQKIQDKVETEGAQASIQLSPVKERAPENVVVTSSLGDARHKSINIEKFRQHVKTLHEEKNKGFEFEFNSLEKSMKDAFKVASKYRDKNRFKNIQPYDFNRVVLNTSTESEESCDYINASYINGYGRDKVYIAAQGPTENTEEDFWRMIFDRKITAIIMLTRVFEGKKKCQQYYPESIEETYQPFAGSVFNVVMNSTTPYADFIIRELAVSKSGGDARQLTMYHYMGWPDHGVPANAMSMITFIKMIRKRYPYSDSDPVLVHCSAGVGRTGSFITVDYMLERIKMEPSINIYEFVSGLRKQRMLMVQTVDQYMFVHTALDELLTCGETEIAAADIRMAIRKLGKIEGTSPISGFQKQFNVLEDVTSNLATADYSEAQRKENKTLNRYKNKLPFSHTQVHLRAATAEESTYINASFVGGYRRPGAYIVTQTPLSNTATHFWRMVKEQQVKCIVMLCRLKENDKDICHRYWPQGKGSPEEFGQFSVTLTSQEIQTGYILRKMDIVEKSVRDETSKFSVIHIQYLQWPENSVPTTTSTVLEIADLVQKIQMGTGNKPVVVMCNDGVNRSGTFLCVHAQMERLKAEGVVDIFQFIKSVRCHRAGLVANKDQYKFCHEALADFLDGFETYANFKLPQLAN